MIEWIQASRLSINKSLSLWRRTLCGSRCVDSKNPAFDHEQVEKAREEARAAASGRDAQQARMEVAQGLLSAARQVRMWHI